MAQQSPELTVLSLDGCGLITDDGLKAVADKCSGLNILSFDGCPQVDMNILFAFAFKCSRLKEAVVNGCKNPLSDSMKKIFEQQYPQLKVTW